MPLQVHNTSDSQPTEELAEKPTRVRKPHSVVYEPYRSGVKVGGRTIQIGSVGDDVKRLQRMLNRRGASLELDGIFGPLTQAAVKRFQKAAKLKADGAVDRQTWAALGW
jgi:peptidoglycan hydrolase-like protein with peptidoglycan-binding domain